MPIYTVHEPPLRSGARAVFAEGITSASWIIYGLFRTGRSMATLFAGSPDFNGSYDFQFSSTRTPGYRAWMDPRAPSRYYRSVIGDLGMTATTWR